MTSIAVAMADTSIEVMPEQPDVRSDAGRKGGRGQRRIHEPAAVGRKAHQHGDDDRTAAEDVDP